jgi:Spy/CpxP family protein refolding chaperone
MQNRTLSIFCTLALASALAMAQSSNPNSAQTNSQNQQSDQQVGIAGQKAPDNSATPAGQQSLRRPATPQRQARALARQLGLSPAQQAQIRPIIADRRQQIETLRADQSLTPRDRRLRVVGVMQDSRNRIEAVLTDSQKQQFEQMLADRRSRRQQQQTQPQSQQPVQPQDQQPSQPQGQPQQQPQAQ